MNAFIKRLWYGETDGLTSAALIIGASSLLSRLFGLLRDRALAGVFGASSLLDSYYAAFRLPDVLYNLIVLGALSAGFIPIYTELFEKKGEKDANGLACRVLSNTGVSLFFLSAILFVSMPWLAPFIFHGFVDRQLELTIQLSRIMCLSPIFLGLSAVMGGVLQSRKRFVAFSLAPVFYNIGILFGIYVLVPWYGIHGVAIGVVLGAAAHFFVQASVGRTLGAFLWCRPSIRDPQVKKIVTLTFPRMTGLGLSQINLVIMTSIASALTSGSISVYQFANNLQSLPLSLFGISYALAAFPILTQSAARQDLNKFTETVVSTIRRVMFLMLPAVLLCLLLRAQIVRLVLGQGAFDWNDTIRTADVFALFVFSLPFQALIPLYVRSFYALQKTWTPVWIGFCAEVFNLLLAWAWRDVYGIHGLALAFSVAALLQGIALSLALKRLLRRPFFDRSMIRFFVTMTVALMVAGFIGWMVRQSLGTLYPLRTTIQVLLQALSTGFVGAISFFLVLHVFRLPEYLAFLRTILGVLRRTKLIREGVDESVKLG